MTSSQNLDNMENTRGSVIGFIFGGQNMKCYQTIIGHVVASVINTSTKIIKIQLDGILYSRMISYSKFLESELALANFLLAYISKIIL
jgi:hypothetical protein